MENLIKIWLGIGIIVLILAALIAGVFAIMDFFTLVGWLAIIPLLILLISLGIAIFGILDAIDRGTAVLTFSLTFILFLTTIYIVWRTSLPNAMPTLMAAKEFGADKAGLSLKWWVNLVPEEDKKKMDKAIIEGIDERKKLYQFQTVRDFDIGQYEASKEHRSGKCLIVWLEDARPARGYFDSPILVNNIAEASSVVWLESNIKKIGKYYIESDLLLKKRVIYSARVTYRAYVVDINSSSITAYKELVGPEPPKKIKLDHLDSGFDYDRYPDSYGIAPIAALVKWIESLPTKNPLP